MTCPICKGSGEMSVITSEPYDPCIRREYRLCICGVMPRLRRGASGNATVEGREMAMPDLSRFRLKDRSVRLKRAACPDPESGPVEIVDFRTLHGIR